MQPNEPDAPVYGPPLATDQQATNSTQLDADRIAPHIRERVLRSANWFFWIAALSLINSIATHSGSKWHFILGLGITEVADAVAGQFGGSGTATAVVFDVLAASIFAGFGLMARRMVLWPFVVGMVAYALDGGLLVLFGDYLSAAFHGYALYCLWLGVSALQQARGAAS
jgi:hypothetical protein